MLASYKCFLVLVYETWNLITMFTVVIGPLVYVMDMSDRIISKLCPFIADGIFIGSVYWTAVTYGAVTVMQVICCYGVTR